MISVILGIIPLYTYSLQTGGTGNFFCHPFTQKYFVVIAIMKLKLYCLNRSCSDDVELGHCRVLYVLSGRFPSRNLFSLSDNGCLVSAVFVQSYFYTVRQNYYRIVRIVLKLLIDITGPFVLAVQHGDDLRLGRQVGAICWVKSQVSQVVVIQVHRLLGISYRLTTTTICRTHKSLPFI